MTYCKRDSNDLGDLHGPAIERPKQRSGRGGGLALAMYGNYCAAQALTYRIQPCLFWKSRRERNTLSANDHLRILGSNFSAQERSTHLVSHHAGRNSWNSDGHRSWTKSRSVVRSMVLALAALFVAIVAGTDPKCSFGM